MKASTVGALGFKLLGAKTLAVPAALVVIMVIALSAAVAPLSGALAQEQDQGTQIQPMPELCAALKDTQHPEYAMVINAVAQVSPEKPGWDCKKPNDMTLRLLAMAWVDSQWGTGQTLGIPLGSGAQLAVQAAMAVGVPSTPSRQLPAYTNLELAVAIAGAESHFNCAAENTNRDGSIDRGLWQINSVHSTLSGGPWDWNRLTDCTYNAQAMMQVSAGGTDWGPWCTFWATGCGATGSGPGGGAVATYLPEAKAAVLQFGGGGMGDGYTGIILMPKSVWAQLGGAGFDPNKPENALRVMQLVRQVMDGLPPGDENSVLTAFYSHGVAKPNQAVITTHVDQVAQIKMLGPGGGVGGIRGQIVAIANAEAAKNIHAAGGECVPYWNSCGVAWCGVFASWVWHQAGVNIGDTPYSGGFGPWGAPQGLTKPPGAQIVPGDVVLWGYGPGASKHVSVVVAVDSRGWISSVDGNWGNAVQLRAPYPPTTVDPSDGPIYAIVSPTNP